MENQNPPSDQMALALANAKAVAGKEPVQKTAPPTQKTEEWHPIVEKLIAFVNKAFVLTRVETAVRNVIARLRKEIAALSEQLVTLKEQLEIETKQGEINKKQADIEAKQKELRNTMEARQGFGENPLVFVNTLRNERSFVSNKDKEKEAEIVAAEDYLASLGENPKTTREEIRLAEKKIVDLRDENRRMAKNLQYELARAIIMNACPGVEADPWPLDIPLDVHEFLMKQLSETEQLKFRPLLSALYGEGNLLNKAGWLLERYPKFRVNRGESLAKTMASDFLNGFLPKALEGIQVQIASPEFRNISEADQGLLRCGERELVDIMGTIPKHLPEWARRSHDSERNKRLGIKETVKTQQPQATTPTKASEPKGVPVKDTDPEIVRDIKVFLNDNPDAIDKKGRRALEYAYRGILDGKAMHLAISGLMFAQNFVKKLGGREEVDALILGVRKHYDELKKAEAPKPEPKPQRPPLNKEDVAVLESDRKITIWLKQEVLIAQWEKLDDDARRAILALCVGIRQTYPIQVINKKIYDLAKHLGESFAPVMDELKDRYNKDRSETYAKWQAKNAAAPNSTKLTQPEPTSEAPKAETEKAVVAPEPRKPRAKKNDFNDKKGDSKVAEAINAFVGGNNSLTRQALGILKQAKEMIASGEPKGQVLQKLNEVIKNEHRVGIKEAMEKLQEGPINEHYKLKALELATAPAPSTSAEATADKPVAESASELATMTDAPPPEPLGDSAPPKEAEAPTPEPDSMEEGKATG